MVMADADWSNEGRLGAMRDTWARSDMNGRFLQFNDAFCRMLGYEREELLELAYHEVTPEKWHCFEADKVLHQVIPCGFSDIYEKEYRRKDGAIIPVELFITLTRDNGGNPSGMLAVVRDISSRIKLQRELHDSREEYRTLAENSPDVLIRFDRNLRHIYANSAAARVVFLTNEELIGRTLFEIGLSEPSAQIWRQRIDAVFETGHPAKLEDTMQGEDGLLHLDYQLVPERSQDGSVSSVLVIGRDMTARKRAEQALLLAHEGLELRVAERTVRLESALKEQESFSYSVSHDLRAPLRHINSYLAILSEEFGDLLPPEAHGFLDRSRTASRRMGILIDDLLELSRVSRTNLAKESVDLSQLAEFICSSLRESEPQRMVQIDIKEGLRTRGDKSLLMQMMQNLLGNAWKYTSGNPAARIEFGKTAGEQEAFYIKDNGVGFDMAYRGKLFGAFQRLHGTEYEGNGIGLATVKRIVDRHHGRVWAESRPGQGATFYFMLPKGRGAGRQPQAG